MSLVLLELLLRQLLLLVELHLLDVFEARSLSFLGLLLTAAADLRRRKLRLWVVRGAVHVIIQLELLLTGPSTRQ